MTRLDDGYQTLFSFANGTVKVWEKSSTPPGLSAGGAIDTTTMHNQEWRTNSPRALKTLTESSFTGAYDPAALSELESMVGVNQLITITFPDGAEVDFWGWMDEFIPGEHVEGEQPEAEITIIPSNQDLNGDEAGPVYRAPPTTTTST